VIESSSPSPSSSETASKVILLERNRELSTFAEILEELGLPTERCATGLPDEDQLDGVGLVVATAQRLLESAHPHLSSWPPTIVVVQDISKTLSAHLHRIGVSMILCQPVHPQALRLLLLHSIYRGPERRTRRRTPIGHPVRVGTGLFKSNATLLELSPSGARVEMARMPKLGKALRVQLGKELTLGRPIKLNTKVMRRIEKTENADRGRPEIGLSILNGYEHENTIHAILDRHADGPAVWKTSAANVDAKLDPRHASKIATIEGAHGICPVAATNERKTLGHENMEDAELGSPIDASERRAQTRIPYNRRIVALDEEAARVLVGYDLSPGGMRVVSNASIAVDDVLKVALHCGSQTEPLVVMARALRDDPDSGLVLGFESLAEGQREHLEKIIAGSGPIRSTQTADCAETGGNDSLFVGEVLESRPASETLDDRSANSAEPLDSNAPFGEDEILA
jgi:hypothetical protein